MNKNNKFYKRLIITNQIDSQKIQNLIAEIEKLNGMWTVGVKLAPQILSVLKRSTIITSTGSSTRIEGSRLSDKEIEKLFSNGLKVKKFNTRDEQEVVGYKELLENVFDSFNNIKFSKIQLSIFIKSCLNIPIKIKNIRGNINLVTIV